MKNIKKLLLLSLLSSSINAGTSTQKTYIQTRPFLANIPMELSTWHTQINKKKMGPWNASIQATSFFQKSLNEKDLGKYFGIISPDTEEIVDNYEFISGDAPGAAIETNYIIHNFDDVNRANNAAGNFRLKPSQRTLGLRLDFYKSIKDFFFKINTPIIYVKNGIYPEIIDDLTVATEGAGTGQTIREYFKGQIESLNDSNQQLKLKYAKINGAQTKTGLGDIEVALGYNLLKNNNHHFKFGIDLNIPTSNSAKGEWLFEPITGNGGYWGLGAFIDGKQTLWKKEKDQINLMANFNVQYLFQNTEKRTLGIQDYIPDVEQMLLGHYRLAGESGTRALFPAANILTRDVKIEPKFNLEGLIGLSFISDDFSLNFGYNIFYKNKENISLKEDWEDNKYALADRTYDSANAPFDIVDDSLGEHGALNSEHIDLEPARTPSVLTNKIYAAVGYSFNEWEHPLMFGIGGGYEFISGNNALENMEIWIKTALSF